jgi:transposase
MGRRKRQRQQTLFVSSGRLRKAGGHPFYERLNQLLADADFDRWIEAKCEAYYEQHEKRGQPSIPPGVFFRMLLVGYFEDIDSQRGIAWRCADSLALRRFLGIPLDEETPDHSSMTRIRQRLPNEIFDAVFQFVLEIAAGRKLVSGKTVAVDSTTLEANAAMKSIVRRDTGEDWQAYVTRLMREEGVIDEDDDPSDEEVRRYDKGRKDKRVSNTDWKSETDEDARITRMKDGRTHLAYKAEHVIDVESELLLAAEIHPADAGDTDTLVDSVLAATENLKQAGSDKRIEEVVADKGYHAAATLELCDALNLRTYIPEPERKYESRWTDKPEEYQRAVYNNRRRIGRRKSKRFQRLRSERVERSFAHVCDTGGARRSWLRGTENVTKRYHIAAAAHNLSIMMRRLFGIGKPRVLQGLALLRALIQSVVFRLVELFNSHKRTFTPNRYAHAA